MHTDGKAVRVRVWGKADEYPYKCTTLSLSAAMMACQCGQRASGLLDSAEERQCAANGFATPAKASDAARVAPAVLLAFAALLN